MCAENYLKTCVEEAKVYKLLPHKYLPQWTEFQLENQIFLRLFALAN